MATTQNGKSQRNNSMQSHIAKVSTHQLNMQFNNMLLCELESDVKQQLDDTSDNEFHDAEEDNDKETLEDKFSDALDLNESAGSEPVESQPEPEPEPELSEEELLANKEKAESLKQEGNTVFKNGDYEKSIDLYTEAISICPKKFTVERAILFNNRAAAHKHLGAQTVAIEDCTKAIENNPNYIKAYAR